MARFCLLAFSITLLTFGFCHVGWAETFVDSDILVNTTWVASDSPYIVSSDLLVGEGATLTINPGVVVKFSFATDLVVDGKLQVVGSNLNPVYFTSAFDYSFDPVLPGDDPFDPYMPRAGDWGGVYFGPQSSGSNLTNLIMRGSDSGLVFDTTTASINSLLIDHSNAGITTSDTNLNTNKVVIQSTDEPLTVFNNSFVLLNDFLASDTGDGNAVTVFNNSEIRGDKVTIADSHSNYQSGLVIFNSSTATINDGLFFNGLSDAITLFNHGVLQLASSTIQNWQGVAINDIGSGGDYSANRIKVDKSVVADNNYGLSLTPDSVIDITQSVIVGNSIGAYNYGASSINLSQNWWGDITGPKNLTSNPSGLGDEVLDGINFSPWLTVDPRLPVAQVPTAYYSQITNFPGGITSLYEQPDNVSTLVKTLPNDFIVYVASTTNSQNQPITANGYRWYKVKDPGDNSEMWMPAGLATGEPIYLPYNQSIQTDLQNRAANLLDGNTADQLTARRNAIIEAVENYFSNASTTKSLYSSDDHLLPLSDLVSAGFPEELILAMIAQEDGPNFNNEIVTYDYGHGIMQVTTDAYAHEAPGHSFTDNGVDPRGKYSEVVLSKCVEVSSDEYKKCHENTSTYNTLTKPYAHYDHLVANPIYKQYVNTTQSIYANIKDGLAVLRSKYGHVYQHPCYNPVILGGLTFSCADLKIVKAVWGYNGATLNPNINYLGLISTKLKNLATYFPGHLYSNNDKLIEKLAYAGNHRREIKVHSPVKLQIFDEVGRMTGVGQMGQVSNNIPNSYYDPDSEAALILFPSGEDTYKITGDGSGSSYGLDIIDDTGFQHTVFQATNIPISAGEIQTYHVNESILAKGGQGVTVDIDRNGDGMPEQVIKTGVALTEIPQAYTFLGFKPKGFDGGTFKKNKLLAIKFRVKNRNGIIKSRLHPALAIVRVSDGYQAKLNPDLAGEDTDCDIGDECFAGHHNRYVYRLPGNTLTVGQWRVQVKLDDGQTFTALINIIN